MVVFEPDGLEGGESRVFEVGHGFDGFAVEVVFHDVIDGFGVGVTMALKKGQQKEVKGLCFDFAQLQIVFTVF